MLDANALVREEENKEIIAKQQAVHVLVQSVTTTAQLEAQWAEAADYYPADLLDRRNV